MCLPCSLCGAVLLLAAASLRTSSALLKAGLTVTGAVLGAATAATAALTLCGCPLLFPLLLLLHGMKLVLGAGGCVVAVTAGAVAVAFDKSGRALTRARG